jgi:hypothetical protein
MVTGYFSMHPAAPHRATKQLNLNGPHPFSIMTFKLSLRMGRESFFDDFR